MLDAVIAHRGSAQLAGVALHDRHVGRYQSRAVDVQDVLGQVDVGRTGREADACYLAEPECDPGEGVDCAVGVAENLHVRPQRIGVVAVVVLVGVRVVIDVPAEVVDQILDGTGVHRVTSP
jgi:hypothetical protein